MMFDVCFSTFKLDDRSQVWNEVDPVLPFSVPSCITEGRSPFVVDAITIKLPWAFPRKKSPVNSENCDRWTEIEREKAEKRIIPTDLDHLRKLV